MNESDDAAIEARLIRALNGLTEHAKSLGRISSAPVAAKPPTSRRWTPAAAAVLAVASLIGLIVLRGPAQEPADQVATSPGSYDLTIPEANLTEDVVTIGSGAQSVVWRELDGSRWLYLVVRPDAGPAARRSIDGKVVESRLGGDLRLLIDGDERLTVRWVRPDDDVWLLTSYDNTARVDLGTTVQALAGIRSDGADLLIEDPSFEVFRSEPAGSAPQRYRSWTLSAGTVTLTVTEHAGAAAFASLLDSGPGQVSSTTVDGATAVQMDTTDGRTVVAWETADGSYATLVVPANLTSRLDEILDNLQPAD